MATFIVGSIVLGAFAAVGISTYRNKKKGRSSCGSCKGCGNAAYCHSRK